MQNVVIDIALTWAMLGSLTLILLAAPRMWKTRDYSTLFALFWMAVPCAALGCWTALNVYTYLFP